MIEQAEQPLHQEYAHLPTPLWEKREYQLPQQKQFSENTHHVMLVKIKQDMDNGMLEDFLERIIQLQSPPGQHIGLLFLISDNISDQSHPEILQEDNRIADFLSAVQSGKTEKIEALSLNERFKQIAKRLMERKEVEVRFDYLTKCPSKHFGKLDRHLFQLAKSFKSDVLSESEIICHFMDMDTVFPQKHIELLDNYYQDSQHEANISSWDLLPGVSEDGDKRITRNMLVSLDQFRLLWYMDFLSGMLSGTVRSESSVISGRLSMLNRSDVQLTLQNAPINNDYKLGTVLRGLEGGQLGHIGEVYNVDHARPNQPKKFESNTELRYRFAQNLQTTWEEQDIHEVFDALKFEAHTHPRLLTHLLDIRRVLYENSRTSFTPDLNESLNMVKIALAKDIPDFKLYIDFLSPQDSNRIYSLLLNYILLYEKTLLDPYSQQERPVYNTKEEHQLFAEKILLFISTDLRKAVPGANKGFKIPNDADKFIKRCMELIHRQDPDFNEQNNRYSELLCSEEQLETAKIRLRQQRLRDVVQIVANSKTITDFSSQEQAIIKPYLTYYKEEIEQAIRKAKLLRVRDKLRFVFTKHHPNNTADDLPRRENDQLIDFAVAELTAKYSDFFNPEGNIHQYMAQIRALTHYVLEKDIKLFHSPPQTTSLQNSYLKN